MSDYGEGERMMEYIQHDLEETLKQKYAGKPNNDETLAQIDGDLQSRFKHSLNCGFLSVSRDLIYVRTLDELKLLIAAGQLKLHEKYKVFLDGEYYADVVYKGTSHTPWSLIWKADLTLSVNYVSVEFVVNEEV